MLLGTQRVNPQGHLEIGGCDTVELARSFGTPLYVVDEDAIRARAREYVRAFRSQYERVDICYAAKAFLCTGICPLIQQEGLHLDVASGGELYTALQAGFPAGRIAAHGNNKSSEELEMALDARLGRIVVDNFHELELLVDQTDRRRQNADILLRVAPGIDPQTHLLIRTGQVDTKFGFDIASGAALQAVRRVQEAPRLCLHGLHCHVGSNLHDSEAHCAAIRILVDLFAELRDRTGIELHELNVGGGLGIRYTEADQVIDLESFARESVAALREQLHRHGLTEPLLLQEPGRYLVGEAGTTLYTVGASKDVPGIRTYLAVDGGLSDNPRPSLYQAQYSALVANRAADPVDRQATIAGKHCETDILLWDLALPRTVAGDILAVQSTGAYNYSMASNYNRFRRPAVVLVQGGRAELLVARESYEDLVRNDRLPSWLA